MVFHLTYFQTSLTGSSLSRAAALAVALVGASAVLWLAGLLSSSRYITGTLLIAIAAPFMILCIFNNLTIQQYCCFLHYGRLMLGIILKNIEPPFSSGT
jgi:low temperature requirement protein LtrA